MTAPTTASIIPYTDEDDRPDPDMAGLVMIAIDLLEDGPYQVLDRIPEAAAKVICGLLNGATTTTIPAGWKLVPIEPTPEQYVRIVGGGITCEQAKTFYRAMIELALPAPALSTPVEG